MAASSKRAPNGQKAFSFQELAPRIPAILWTTDLQFQLTSLVGGGLQRLGISTRSRPSSIADLFRQDPSNSKAVDAHFLAAGGDSCAFEFELNKRDFQAHVEPIRDGGGQITGVIGIAVDDTERLVSQRALRMSEQSYRSLIEEAPHAICRSTATGNLLQVNRAMLEMLGYSEPDMLVRNLRDEVFADSESYDEFLENLRGRKSLHGFESAWARRDGRVLQVSIGGRLAADSSGKISYVDFIAENISERKQLEGQLRQAAPDWREHRIGFRARSGPLADQSGSWSDRASHYESGSECTRCHGRWRNSHHRNP
jgi:PAS domain S-box-containing protein